MDTLVLHKVCSKCKINKPLLTNFYNDKSRSDGFAYQCKKCQNSAHGEQDRSEYLTGYYKNNKPKASASTRARHLKVKYGITPEKYAELLFLQGGVCTICKGPGKAYKKLCVDHNHETGKIRGLLCNTCNAGLGQFSDNIELLQLAIDYLRGSDSL